MKLSDLNPFNKLKKKEVKMSKGNLEQRLADALEKVQDLPERMSKLEEKVERGLTQPSTESSESEQPEEIEQLKGRIAELEQKEPLLKRQGAEEFVEHFEVVARTPPDTPKEEQFNLSEGEEYLTRRILSALTKAGFIKELESQLAGAVATGEVETEEAPEPPYLHIIDEERLGRLSDEERKEYSPWAEGKFARLVEAV